MTELCPQPPVTPGWSIAPGHPFDFALSLAYIRRRAGELVDRAEGDAYRRLLHLPSGRVLIEVRAEGSELRLSVPWSDGSIARGEITRHVRHVFSLDADLPAFYRAMAANAEIAGLVDRFYGLRPVLAASPFEALVWAIIGQQITLTFAFTLKGRLVERYGEHISLHNTVYHTFPLPAALAAASIADLRAMQFSERKAQYVIGLADLVTTGKLDLSTLHARPLGEAIERLTTVRGIGRWTAEYALMRGVGERDALPASDIGLRNAVSAVYNLDHQATEAEVRELGERWRPWRSYAAFYLWATLWPPA